MPPPFAPQPRRQMSRSEIRILIIGSGFGLAINPQQGRLIKNAGFEVFFCHGLPNPEGGNFDVRSHLHVVQEDIRRYQPHVLAAASKGGVYVVGVWNAGIWRGATLLLNAHPTCRCIPQGMNVVLAHGMNDEHYKVSREHLERLISTGSPNRCFLYITMDSGLLATGVHTRKGDMHNMQSILLRDCLPRLIDSLLCPEGPEVHMMRTWHGQLSPCRIAAETWLGYCPERVGRLWVSRDQQQAGDRPKNVLYAVPPGSEEFKKVEQIFKAPPEMAPAYRPMDEVEWMKVRVVAVDRIENLVQEEFCRRPYYEHLKGSLSKQGVTFEPGVHSCWAFHGCCLDNLFSIAESPKGFEQRYRPQSWTSVWGSGFYFAREALYVAGGHFCNPPARDGTRKMLLCQLLLGASCLGDPKHTTLPFRQRPHRYNSSVDSLSSPEIYVLQESGAIYPAYVITFA